MEFEWPVEFEWNEKKRRTVIREHGLDFREVRRAFDSPRIVDFDFEHSQCKPRWKMLGYLEGNVIFVVYTKRGSKIRSITARQADREEIKTYYQQFFGEVA